MVKISDKKHVTKTGVVKKNPKKQVLKPLGIFATKTPKELQDYIEMMTPKEKQVAYLSWGLTINTLSYELKKEGVNLKPMGLFATKSQKELEEYFKNFTGNEKAIVYLIHGLTWNMVASQVNK